MFCEDFRSTSFVQSYAHVEKFRNIKLALAVHHMLIDALIQTSFWCLSIAGDTLISYYGVGVNVATMSLNVRGHAYCNLSQTNF
jgi:hypothetical protein